jgi:hypothetical protein
MPAFDQIELKGKGGTLLDVIKEVKTNCQQHSRRKKMKTYDVNLFRIKVGDPVTLRIPYEGEGKVVKIHRDNIITVRLKEGNGAAKRQKGKIESCFVEIDEQFLRERR